MRHDEFGDPEEIEQARARKWPDGGSPPDDRAPAVKPYPLTFLGDIDASASKDWLVHGVLGMGELSDIFGAPGSGKSVLVGDMAFHVAAGLDWNGYRVKQSAVLYVAAERSELVKRRFLALRNTYGHDDAPLAVIGGSFALAQKAEDTARIIATAQELTETAGTPCRWVIIDTKNRAMAGADENSAKDMGMLVTNLGEIQNATGAHVTVIDHMPHDGQRMRGHGALLGAVDSTFRITKAGDIRTMEIDKVNDGPDDLRFAFALESIEIGTDDETGDVTTAPIVKALEGVTASQNPTGRKLTKSATIALRALQTAIDEAGEVPPASNHIPPGIKTVTADTWREYAARMGISPAGNTDAVRIAFKRASESLIASGHVASWSPHVWTTG
ncbi:MAG: AAA family ATPase [Salinarimonas sp.]|nr:AAA family ATPase [Salinarimonas sp.]